MIEYFTSAGECSLITIRQPTEESANLSESAKTQLVHGDEAFEFNVQLAVDLRLLPYAPYINYQLPLYSIVPLTAAQ